MRNQEAHYIFRSIMGGEGGGLGYDLVAYLSNVINVSDKSEIRLLTLLWSHMGQINCVYIYNVINNVKISYSLHIKKYTKKHCFAGLEQIVYYE